MEKIKFYITTLHCRTIWSNTIISVNFRVLTGTGKPRIPGKMKGVFPVWEKSGNFKILAESYGKVGESQGKVGDNKTRKE